MKTKEKYIKYITETEINKNSYIEKEKINFNLHFVDNPFLEIKSNTDYNFDVEFFDSDEKLIYKSSIKSNMWCKLNKEYFENWKVKIKYNNKIKELKYDAENKNVYISINSKSLGDNIAWMPYLEEFRKKHNCNLIVSTFWNNLFENMYNDIHFIKPGEKVRKLYAKYKIGWFYNKNKEPVLPNTIPLQKTATNILGLEYKEIKPRIDFKEKERPFKEKYIVIAPHSTAGLKYWHKKGWQEIVNFLTKKGYKVINISLKEYKLNNLEELNDKSIENTMNVIYHSEFLIGLSSGLSWLSWALNKHVVMISNFTKENHEFTSNCTRIINKSVCNSCWNNPNFKFDKGDWNWCPIFKGTERHFECHESITSDMIINKLLNII